MSIEVSEGGLRTINRELGLLQGELEDKGSGIRVFPLQRQDLLGRDTVDLSVADEDCPRCRGKGIAQVRPIMIDGKLSSVPVVCSCVVKNGGARMELIEDKFRAIEERVPPARPPGMHSTKWDRMRRERRKGKKKHGKRK
jgi:hypothetical protein